MRRGGACHNLTYRSTQEYDKRVAWFKKHPVAMLAALEGKGKAPLTAIKAALDRWDGPEPRGKRRRRRRG